MQVPIMPDPQAYPGHQPADTLPQAPAVNGTPGSIGSVHHTRSASTSTAQNSNSKKRKRHDEQQEEDNEDSEANKKTEGSKGSKGSKGDKGVQTKNRKAQDKVDRDFLIRLRDEAASRIFDMASRHILAGAEWNAFQQQWERLMELNREIDGNTEEYISWGSTRSNLRKTDRAVPERKKED
jgi:hypothetical protein